MRIHLFYVFFIVFFVTFSNYGQNLNKEIVIATAPFAPFRIINASNESMVEGSDADIVRDVFARINYKVTYEVYPLPRAWDKIKVGEISGFVSLTKNQEREQYCIFSDQLNTVKDVFFKLKKNKITWNTLEDLKKYKVGYSDYNYAQVFKDAIAQNLFARQELVKIENPEVSHLSMLLKERTDIFIAEASVGQYLINVNSPKFDEIDYIDKPIGDIRPFFFVMSKKYPNAESIMKEFNKELAKFVKEGKRKAIFKKYGIQTTLE
ncbi:MAG TPA: transporter substrate-binding domain-containing protein [Spirochaetota bacterium]|nr:transporter substrate-binding domain-containing protein [Spirochaetota bacterium]